MHLKNYTEVVANQILNDIIKSEQTDVCTCEKCRLDIMAKALNNLPAHYYVSDRGEVFSKLTSSYNDFRIKVITELTKAILHIENNPNHHADFAICSAEKSL